MGILAIDFGTSRIKAAYWDEARGEAVMLPLGKRGQLYVPSLFHVGKDGKIRFGEDAEVMLHHDPQGVVENLKLDLDKPIKYVPNGQRVKSGELMALLFSKIIEYASRQVKPFEGKAPSKVVLTLPSRWDYSDIYMDALDAVGYKGEKLFVREPEAAGLAWVEEEKPQSGELLVVLDFGGGTVDWASLRVDGSGRPVVIAELPPGGITAAGADVDRGLFDGMMNRISEEHRRYVQDHRALVIEQIRQMKEMQNAQATLSGEGGARLEVQLGSETFEFGQEVFDEVVRLTAVDQAVEGIGGYVKKVVKTVQEGSGSKRICCVLAGGTRLLAGLENRVKERIEEIGKAGGVETDFVEIAQADFATVRGAVLRGAPVSSPRAIIGSGLNQISRSTPTVAARFTVVVVGQMRSGKSTLINALIGKDIAPTVVNECTVTINHFIYSDKPELHEQFRVRWLDESEDYFPLSEVEKWKGHGSTLDRTKRLEFFAATRFLKTVNIIDIPGWSRSTIEEHERKAFSVISRKIFEDRGQNHEKATRKEGESADAVVYVLNSVARENDADMLDLFGENTRLSGSNPYNSVAVVHMWEKDWDDMEVDPLQFLEGKINRIQEQLKGKVSTVMAVSALLSRCLDWLQDEHWEFFSRFGKLSRDEVKKLTRTSAFEVRSDSSISLERRKAAIESIKARMMSVGGMSEDNAKSTTFALTRFLCRFACVRSIIRVDELQRQVRELSGIDKLKYFIEQRAMSSSI